MIGFGGSSSLPVQDLLAEASACIGTVARQLAPSRVVSDDAAAQALHIAADMVTMAKRMVRDGIATSDDRRTIEAIQEACSWT